MAPSDHMDFMWARLRLLALVGAGVFVAVACDPPAADQFFVVDTTADTIDAVVGDGVCADGGGQCSLRAAVMEANADPNATEIQLTGGTRYTLSIPGALEDASMTGDLDLTERTYIRSTIGAGQATIDADGLDRVIDVHGGDFNYLEGLVITGGETSTSDGFNGGGILARAGLVGIEDTRITSNWSSQSGGGVANTAAALWFEDSTIDNNTAATGTGGGIYAAAYARLFQTTVTDNTGNLLDAEIGVGIIPGNAELVLNSSTVTGDNYALDLYAGGATIIKSIVAAPIGCTISPFFGAITSGNNNVTTDTTCALGAAGDQQNTDPALMALNDNGGPVPTRLPSYDSPALDTYTCPSATRPDARQQARPSGSGCDTGATETQPSEAVGADCTQPPNIAAFAQLQNCNLTNANLEGVDLYNANLTGADLAEANLTGGFLNSADLTNATLTGANVSGAILFGADVTGADFTGADLTGLGSGSLIGTPTALPAGWQLTNGYLVGPGANLAIADLTGADLTGANLTDANLTDANLTGANLTGIGSGGIIGTPAALPTGWQLTNGYLVGPGANLTGADLTGAFLNGANLTGADFTGATLVAATLTNTDLTGADLTGADLTGADLYNADLTNAVLNGATLVGADLQSAVLTGADLTGADFGFAFFDLGATLTTASDGQYVTISWPAASPSGSPVEPVTDYQVEMNGTVIALIPSPATSCVLTGLGYNQTYSPTVTTYDTGGQYSGSSTATTINSVSGSFTTGSIGVSEGNIDCVDPTDTDSDRLPDAVETDTGVFVDHSNTGSDPAVADTDGDGIEDGDDTIGTADGLDIGYLGTNPLRQDLLIEFDWFDDNQDNSNGNPCAAHSHGVSPAIINSVDAMFANAPTTNPDGSTGINLIADYGQGGYGYEGGNLIAGNGELGQGVNGADFQGYKAANFAPNRNGYYHYTLMAHSYPSNPPGSSGQAELPGDDLIVTLYCNLSDTNVANTIAHELGHNLNLHHGGTASDPNWKPNYNSVMNYEYQFSGIDTDCTIPGNGMLDYSNGNRPSLDETALDEEEGICNAVPIDWDRSGSIDATDVTSDINPYDQKCGNPCFGPGDGSTTDVHTDHDDWANLDLGNVVDPDNDGAPLAPVEIVTEQPVPLEYQQ